MNTKSQSCPPLTQPFLIKKTYMNSHRFLMWYIINSLQNKTVILLIFRSPKDIISEVIRFNFLLSLSIKNIFIEIKSQFFLFPSLDVKTSWESNSIQHPWKIWFRLHEIIIDEIEQISHNHTIIEYFLLPTECSKSRP